MSGIGTNIDFNVDSNFDFLKNLKEDQKLKIKVELGYLDIPRRQNYPAAYVKEQSINQFYQNPGGVQGESFVQNDILRKLKSSTLRPSVNGLMPPHVEIVGAPWATFLEGTILPNETHPYYDLIKGPKNAPLVQSDSTLQYNQEEPVILSQDYKSVDNPETILFNKLGRPFIPATTKNSSAIKNLKLPVVPTYNIWRIDNIDSQYYDFQKYLGYIPKNSAPVNKLQPYAQTWSYANNPQIQVYSSNAQVKLTRMYPICEDYAHNSESKYCIYNSATTTPQLEIAPIGLTQKIPVGFSIKFSNIVTNNSLPVQIGSGEQATAVNPQIIISWGDVNATQKDLQNKYSANQIIGKYTLVLTPGSPPVIYFNIADVNNPNTSFFANQFNIELSSLKPIQASDKVTADKIDSEYTLYVYYSGEYLKIGNDPNPNSWQVVRSQKFTPRDGEGRPVGLPQILYHNLQKDSTINIQAQFCNFVFSYGPALFQPQDERNIPSNASPGVDPGQKSTDINENLFNTNNFVTGTIPYDGIKPDPSVIKSKISNFIKSNFVKTYEIVGDDSGREFGGASAYVDARAKDNVFEIAVKDLNPSDTKGSLSYKITFPKHLGGTVFNKFLPDALEEPKILESYAKYDLGTIIPSADNKKKPTYTVLQNISSVLTQSVDSMTIAKSVDNYRVKSTLDISFLNLNRTDVGLSILNFMRKNVCVLRISAGYDSMHYYFEGMVGEIAVSESLDKTVVEVKAVDLLDSLFIAEKTQLVSLNNMQFPGMRFDNIIKHIYNYTELYKHLEYDLGDNVPGTIYYVLKNCSNSGLPKIVDSSAEPNLAYLQVGAYDTNYTVWKSLEAIAKLLIQTNTNITQSSSACAPNRFDVPIYYWLANGSVDGIAMSSRTLPKDRDVFYIRSSNITELMTKDISKLHGYMRGGENASFKSQSNSDNIFARGLYRGLDIDGQPFRVEELNANSTQRPGNLLENFNGYIGYDKIVIFDKGAESMGDDMGVTRLGNKLLNEDYAKRWIKNVFAASYQTVYEKITLNVYVTKPLKEWGNFGICVESDDIQVPETFLYDSITYTFNLKSNLIEVTAVGEKKPIQNF